MNHLPNCSCTGNPIWNKLFNPQPGDVPDVDEKSLMISGMIPIILEFNGIPIWINRDVNSPRSFRPARYGMEVIVFESCLEKLF